MSDTADTTVKKVHAPNSPKGGMGQTYLVSGKRVSMRLWQHESVVSKTDTVRDYETVGYVIEGRAKLDIEGQIIDLPPGDSWLVPAHFLHRYDSIEPVTAVEAHAAP